MVNPRFTGVAEVVTVPLADLLATKLRAFYQRRKGRDLFDLRVALDRFPDLDMPKVLKGFQTVMEREGHPITWRVFELNMKEKVCHAHFGVDVPPLLVNGRFDAQEAWEAIAPRLKTVWG